MDKYTKEYFDKVIAKDLLDMSESDKAFIRARASYLDRHNARRLQSILNSENTDQKPPVEENPVNNSIHPADRQDAELLEEDKQTEEIVV